MSPGKQIPCREGVFLYFSVGYVAFLFKHFIKM